MSAVYIPGPRNIWADVLTRLEGLSVHWTLRPSVFHSLVDQFGLPDFNLFADLVSVRLSRFLSRDVRIQDCGPDAFMVEWNQWGGQCISFLH